MKYSHVSASASPPPSPIAQVKLSLFQSPVRYGKTISTKQGMQSSPPVTYPNQTAGRTPNTLITQTRMIRPMPMTIGSEKSKPAVVFVQSLSENHCDWISAPATNPLIDSTTDQPIQ